MESLEKSPYEFFLLSLLASAASPGAPQLVRMLPTPLLWLLMFLDDI